MTKTVSSPEFLDRLALARRLCPEMRFGQLVATIGLLAEDETGRNLWDIEDNEFAAAIERFATDLTRRERIPTGQNAAADRPRDMR
jgi:hypothetical protein